MDRSTPLEACGIYNALADREGWHSICFADASFSNAKLNALLSLWRGLPAQDGIPRRRDLTPQLLRAYLTDIAIYERLICPDGRERWRVRVMGGKFGEVLGDFNGKYFDEAVPPQHRARWQAAPEAVLAARTPLRFVSRSETADKGFITGEYLMAPLLGDNDVLNTVLSAGAFGPTY
ncbi:MAG TPA: PAS domain-containing protein [Rhizomicrobium sp.]|nr:PAS domain-containing protein [Rhizomicrobium sp.]